MSSCGTAHRFVKLTPGCRLSMAQGLPAANAFFPLFHILRIHKFLKIHKVQNVTKGSSGASGGVVVSGLNVGQGHTASRSIPSSSRANY